MSHVDEHMLTDTLHRQAATARPGARPVGALRARRAASRSRRRRRTTGALAGALTAVALLQTEVVPLPAWAPAVAVDAFAHRSALLDGPTRGSLAGDREWLDGLRAAVQNRTDPEGEWRVVDREDIKILYAGDLPGQRRALLVVPLRLGLIQVNDTMWYEGPLGARPEQMEWAGSASADDVVAHYEADSEGLGGLLVLAPPGPQSSTRPASRSAPTGGCTTTGPGPRRTTGWWWRTSRRRMSLRSCT